MKYHKTKDILHVKKTLGHKRIDNTMIYANLKQAHFQLGENKEYMTKVAKTVKGARAPLEAGFEYATDIEEVKL